MCIHFFHVLFYFSEGWNFFSQRGNGNVLFVDTLWISQQRATASTPSNKPMLGKSVPGSQEKEPVSFLLFQRPSPEKWTRPLRNRHAHAFPPFMQGDFPCPFSGLKVLFFSVCHQFESMHVPHKRSKMCWREVMKSRGGHEGW